MRTELKALEAAVIAIVLWIGAASADELTAAHSHAIVERQFDAFARNDAAAAYALADPTIQTMFGDADHFLAMVRDSYPPVYRHRSVEFGAFAQLDDDAALQVTLVDDDDVAWTALYKLRREANGDWRILGCVLEKLDGSAI